MKQHGPDQVHADILASVNRKAGHPPSMTACFFVIFPIPGQPSESQRQPRTFGALVPPLEIDPSVSKSVSSRTRVLTLLREPVLFLATPLIVAPPISEVLIRMISTVFTLSSRSSVSVPTPALARSGPPCPASDPSGHRGAGNHRRPIHRMGVLLASRVFSLLTARQEVRLLAWKDHRNADRRSPRPSMGPA